MKLIYLIVSAKIIGGKGKFKGASGILSGTGTQLYIPGTPTTFDFTLYVNY